MLQLAPERGIADIAEVALRHVGPEEAFTALTMRADEIKARLGADIIFFDFFSSPYNGAMEHEGWYTGASGGSLWDFGSGRIASGSSKTAHWSSSMNLTMRSRRATREAVRSTPHLKPRSWVRATPTSRGRTTRTRVVPHRVLW